MLHPVTLGVSGTGFSGAQEHPMGSTQIGFGGTACQVDMRGAPEVRTSSGRAVPPCYPGCSRSEERFDSQPVTPGVRNATAPKSRSSALTQRKRPSRAEHAAIGSAAPPGSSMRCSSNISRPHCACRLIRRQTRDGMRPPMHLRRLASRRDKRPRGLQRRPITDSICTIEQRQARTPFKATATAYGKDDATQNLR